MHGTNRLSTVVTLLLFTLFSQQSALALHEDGIGNAGFEEGLLDWDAPLPAAAAVVVGTEGPADSTTYADRNITVDPFIGAQMLRLASPKNINEQQNRGDNKVSQTFTASSETVSFSFRLFSWDHRGDDTFSFDLRNNDKNGASGFVIGTPLKIGNGPNTSCSVTPCNISIDVGKRGNFIDTGWVVVELFGLKVDGNYTIEYNIAGGQNEALGSWGYFDNVNSPPVARFNFAPDMNPLESDIIQFIDGSYDPDEPRDEIVSWTWEISGPGIDPQVINVQNPLFQFPNEGNYTVTLTVEDTYGATNTVSDGIAASDGTPVPELTIFDAEPRLKALNMEVLAGEEATLFGRFLDPGVADVHGATWNLGATSLAGNLVEEHEPMLSTGTIIDQYTFNADCLSDPAVDPECEVLSASLTVYDLANSTSATEGFTVLIYSEINDINNREPNNDLASAPLLESGWSYLSTIDAIGDVDLFEIVLPGGAAPGDVPFKAGSEILVNLSDLPADYDIVILSDEVTSVNSNYKTAPYNFLPYNFLPYNFLPYNFLPYNFLPYNFLPYNFLPYNFLPYNFLPYNFLPYNFLPYNFLPYNFLSPYENFEITGTPLSHLGSTPLYSNLSGTDIGLSELGLETLIGSGVNVISHSVNRGFLDEETLIRVATAGTRYFVAIVGNNGVFNKKPYTLQIETSIPAEREVSLGKICESTPRVAAVDSTSTPIELYSAGTNTLIVTQEQRMRAIYGDVAWDAMYLDMVELADIIGATIVSLPSTIFDAWDSQPCNVDKANLVADDIQAVIMDAKYANAEYVVLTGSDNIIPSRRVPDETVLSNERLYASSSFLKPQSPLAASLADGYMLTDDFYVDPSPVAWQGRELYLPKRSISRLVEKPAEISATIQAFLLSNGEINDTLTDATAMVTGYDFFTDGAQLSLTFLSDSFLTPSNDPVDDLLISDSWNADDLRCNLLGYSKGGLLDCLTHNISNFNAHMSHFAALSANGYNNLTDFSDSANEILTSTEVADAGPIQSALSSKLIYTMGCHAGMNVPDSDVLNPEFFGLLSDPGLDFAQAMARQGSVYVASTGYGIGDDAGIAGTEGIMAMFSEELAKGGTVGNALMNAKLNYYGSLLAPTAYDEKSLVQTIMYGLPMYRVNVPGGGTGTTTPDEVSPGLYTLDATNLNLTELSIPGTGNYYTVSGLAQSTSGRPLQPKKVVNLTLAPGEQVNGVLLLSGTYQDFPDYDPVISRPTTEWEINVSEPQVCLNAFWPSVITEINTIEFPDSIQQKLVVSPGQFRCTDPNVSGHVIGEQRIYSTLVMNILSSTTSNDQQAPQVSAVDLMTDDTGAVSLTVYANDNVGVDQIVVLIFDNGVISSVESGPLTGTSPYYTLDLGVITAGSKLVTQVADAAGNVSTWTGKGANVRAILVDAGPDQLFSPLAPTTLTATITGFADLLTEADDITYVWDFNDGHYDTDPLGSNKVAAPGVTIDADGNATFSVVHQYTEYRDFTPSLKVTGGFGGIGVDDLQLRLCGDQADFPTFPNLDLVGCAVENTDTIVSITLSVAGTIAPDMQFRLFLDLNGKGKNSPPDGKTDEFLKYKDGVSTGLKSLIVTELDDGKSVKFEFDLSELKWKGSYFNWYAETQDGVAGQQSTGHADLMPDSGTFNYITQ